MSVIADYYDVVIIGAGPAGSTLGALLTRETGLSVLLVESEQFPRQHIGESLTHVVVPLLEQSGALQKVLDSDCYVTKYGGYYFWDGAIPWVTFFEHSCWEKDQQLRWAFHVNRAEFDHLLAEHARDCGCQVIHSTTVTGIEYDGEVSQLTLDGYGTIRCAIVADASGRERKRGGDQKDTDYLLNYRNVALWCHVEGGKKAQSVAADWNIFHHPDVSPIANFAFEDGWFWYIPVPMTVAGERKLTHSLGLVTHPQILKQKDKNYHKLDYLLQTARSVPILGELLATAEPVYDKLLTTRNYSMISPRICDYQSRYIALGDAAYFVDPLFSTGVSFALIHAAAAAVVIRKTLDASVTETVRYEAWCDYQEILQQLARSFAIGIDQWYSAIAQDNPASVYWSNRTQAATLPLRREAFQALINVGLSSDLVQVLSKGTGNLGILAQQGPLTNVLDEIMASEPDEDDLVRLRTNVALKQSVTQDIVLAGISQGKPNPLLYGPYWQNPLLHADEVQRLYDDLIPCQRFYFTDRLDAETVRFTDDQQGQALYQLLLNDWCQYGELKQQLGAAQEKLLLKLLLAEMVEIRTQVTKTASSLPLDKTETPVHQHG